MIRDNRREEGTHEGLGDDERGVSLEIEERTFEPTWRSDADGYLRGVRPFFHIFEYTRPNWAELFQPRQPRPH